MQLPNLAIKNYQFVIMVVLLGIFVGVSSYLSMPRSEDPNPDFPFFTVIVVYPGTDPEDLEELVVDPIEEVIDEIDEIVEIETIIEEGLVEITVEGEFGIDAEDKLDEIIAAVNTIRDDLPSGIVNIDFQQFKPIERVTIAQYGIVSDLASYSTMFDYAEEFERILESVAGIKQASIHAYPEEEIRVSVDFPKMAQLNISLGQVLGILQNENANIPGGDISACSKSFNIISSGGYKSLDEIRNTVIKSNQEKMVYLKDIAQVDRDYEDIRWKARYDGEKALWITLKQKPGENIVLLGERLSEAADAFRQQLPPNIRLVNAFEQAPAVKARIDGFFLNLLQGVALVGLVIFIFLGFRSSVIIMTVIPISIILAIAALDASDYTLQQISIASLVIALGLLVDNGIVVIENISRFLREGYTREEAAAAGTGEVGYAIISSTTTTLLAFFPLALLSSGAGEFLRSLPITVILVLIASLILALTFTPMLASKLMPIPQSKETRKYRLQSFIDHTIEKGYMPALRFALRYPWIVMGIAILTFLGSAALFPSIGVSFFPTADKPILLIEIDTPNGSNIDETDKAVEYVESILDTIDYVASYSANSGHGNPMVYYNRINENYKKNHGQVLVSFTSWDPPRFYQTLAYLREVFSLYPQARITFSELKNGPPFEAPVEILLIGDNLDTLKQIAFDVEQIIENTEGTININNPLAIDKTNLKVNIDRERAGMSGISLIDIDRAVRSSLKGLTVDKATLEDGEEYPIVVRLPYDDGPSIEDLNRVYFTNFQGNAIPLRHAAQIEFEAAVNKIQHFNLERNTAITADLINPEATTQVVESIIPKLDAYDMPKGYRYRIAGEYAEQQKTFGDLGTLLIIAMLGIFAVLVLQFRSFSQPLVVFSAIPLALTGSFVALFLTGWSFSFFAFVGFISLVGIVVNNSIILVDYTNQLLERGMTKHEALIKACQTRFTPIILTTSTTILGLLPLTLSQTQLWSPLGWTIIGGMISSTALTLLIVPVLYNWLSRAA